MHINRSKIATLRKERGFVCVFFVLSFFSSLEVIWSVFFTLSRGYIFTFFFSDVVVPWFLSYPFYLTLVFHSALFCFVSGLFVILLTVHVYWYEKGVSFRLSVLGF